MDTNGYLVCNGGGLVFCSVVDVGGGERELWTSCTLTHAHTHTYTQLCTQHMNNNYNYYTDYNSNNYTTTVTTIYNHVLSFHPHFFPIATKARSIATVPPPQKKKKKPQHAYTSSLSSSICFFRYFVFSLYLRLLLPSPRLSSSAITYTNTRRARVPRSNKAAGMIDR